VSEGPSPNEPQSGRHRHYKGNDYTVIGVARHSETSEEFVVYRQEYGERGLWVRPKTMFMETVNVDGHDMPRFQRIESEATGGRPSVTNLLADVPRQIPSELFTTLLEADNVRIERIVSQGQASPGGFWYDQAQHEWVMVLKGAARLRFEDECIELKPGDFISIPAHKKHRVDWTTPDEATVWLAVHYNAGFVGNT
jgi:cupin 2 domain-containing protein